MRKCFFLCVCGSSCIFVFLYPAGSYERIVLNTALYCQSQAPYLLMQLKHFKE